MISARLKSLFGAKVPSPAPSISAGVVAYAIGDVHGRDDLLSELIDHIFHDPGFVAAERRVVVGLGDYIDRGPNSRRAIEIMILVKSAVGVESHMLRGNHDQTMLDFLEDPGAGVSWCEFGGREALMSYGVHPPASRSDAEGWEAARQALAAAISPSHLRFMRSLELSFELGDYFFAHAGARPVSIQADGHGRGLLHDRCVSPLADARAGLLRLLVEAARSRARRFSRSRQSHLPGFRSLGGCD